MRLKRSLFLKPALSLCVGLLLVLPLHGQQKVRMENVSDVSKWISSQFAKGKTPPFSFIYDGISSDSFITSWTFSAEKMGVGDPNVEKQRFTWQDPKTGLKIDCTVTGFRNFGAVEWVMRLTNTGSRNTPVLDRFMVIDQTFESRNAGEFSVIHANGSCGVREDFMVSHTKLEVDDALHMAPEGGRSSDRTAFPFFNLIAPGEQQGVAVAVGWTGGWQADITARSGKSASLISGMERFRLYLKPGETIRTPMICLVFWEGQNLMAGQNKFRRFQMAHHSRKIDGELQQGPYAAGFSLPGPAPCTEYGCLTEDMAIAVARRMKQFDIVPEVLWLDAGWYKDAGAPNYDWCDIVGSWTPDTTRFPNGLKPLADEAHRLGAKFLLWFEPERVSRFSWLAVNKPQWMLHSKVRNSAMLDLGDPEALDWLCNHIGDMIEEVGIDIYRQDFNHPGRPFWVENEEPDRMGMLEIRHIEGLYAFWDYLIDRFPRIQLDNCAAGGRRIDIEMMSRSLPLWRTDYPYQEVTGKQGHVYGLNMFIAQHGSGIYRTDAYTVRSCLSAAQVSSWDLYTSAQKVSDIQSAMNTFKKYRPYFLEDYYPLTGIGVNTTGDDIWIAYQLHCPSDNSGIVLGFRRPEAASDRYPVQLQALDPDTVYEVYNDNTGITQRMTGREMSERVMLWAKEKPGSVLLEYKPVAQ